MNTNSPTASVGWGICISAIWGTLLFYYPHENIHNLCVEVSPCRGADVFLILQDLKRLFAGFHIPKLADIPIFFSTNSSRE